MTYALTFLAGFIAFIPVCQFVIWLGDENKFIIRDINRKIKKYGNK